MPTTDAQLFLMLTAISVFAFAGLGGARLGLCGGAGLAFGLALRAPFRGQRGGGRCAAEDARGACAAAVVLFVVPALMAMQNDVRQLFHRSPKPDVTRTIDANP